jgi:hypothetical protein
MTRNMMVALTSVSRPSRQLSYHLIIVVFTSV